ncbi:hypothetical protein AWC38_SpisGene24717 [Stylophora pistillata]|uniref:Uncharacterized protein n=1 Tax=Stylophora pistillata TaxID=50429 RepID=A0A2B4R5F7_STYPI|nr:hypothetical protein AWC38_SpisGene24717 [Stylophora pistillata]
MSATSDYPEIVPKSAPEARGIDFCGTEHSLYIIRSDVGVYMKCEDIHAGKDIKIHRLSEACRWGDYYLATDSYFYIIKGNEYRRVTDLSSDDDAVVYSLHRNCRGGSGYYSAFGKYYIVFANKGTYRRVSNMNKDEDPVEYKINQAFQDGIYFWGTNDYVYCLKQAGKWGVTYHKSTNMNLNKDEASFSVRESVLKFIPGGIAHTHGKVLGFWKDIKRLQNDSNIAVQWEKTIKKTVGFDRSTMSTIEFEWSIEMGISEEVGIEAQLSELIKALCKVQISLKEKYGGNKVNTEQFKWSDSTEEDETFRLKIPPNTKLDALIEYWKDYQYCEYTSPV